MREDERVRTELRSTKSTDGTISRAQVAITRRSPCFPPRTQAIMMRQRWTESTSGWLRIFEVEARWLMSANWVNTNTRNVVSSVTSGLYGAYTFAGRMLSPWILGFSREAKASCAAKGNNVGESNEGSAAVFVWICPLGARLLAKVGLQLWCCQQAGLWRMQFQWRHQGESCSYL